MTGVHVPLTICSPHSSLLSSSIASASVHCFHNSRQRSWSHSLSINVLQHFRWLHKVLPWSDHVCRLFPALAVMCPDYSCMQILTQECMFLGCISMNFIGLSVHCLQIHPIACPHPLEKACGLYFYQWAWGVFSLFFGQNWFYDLKHYLPVWQKINCVPLILWWRFFGSSEAKHCSSARWLTGQFVKCLCRSFAHFSVGMLVL